MCRGHVKLVDKRAIRAVFVFLPTVNFSSVLEDLFDVTCSVRGGSYFCNIAKQRYVHSYPPLFFAKTLALMELSYALPLFQI